MNKKKIFIIIGIIIIISAVGFGAYKAFADRAESKIPVELGTVEEQDISSIIFTNGVVVSNDKRNLSFSRSGQVSKINIEEGDKVTQGEVIATLKKEDIENEIEKMKLSLEIDKNNYEKFLTSEITNYKIPFENAKLNYEKAQKDYEDGKSLYESGAISKSQLEEYKHAYDLAYNNFLSARNTYNSFGIEKKNLKLSIENTEIAIEDLQNKLDESELKAPFTGYITQSLVDDSDVVFEENPAFIIEDLENLQVEANISQYDISDVEIGQEVKISRIGADEFYKGEVIKIAKSAVDSGQQSVVPVVIDIIDDTNYKTNFKVNIELTTASKEKAKVIPYEAVFTTKEGQKMVYEVEDEVVKAHEVELGIRGDFNIEVISDELKIDDKLVLSPTEEIKDGVKVTYSEEK